MAGFDAMNCVWCCVCSRKVFQGSFVSDSELLLFLFSDVERAFEVCFFSFGFCLFAIAFRTHAGMILGSSQFAFASARALALPGYKLEFSNS